jgi:hypothetical protein
MRPSTKNVSELLLRIRHRARPLELLLVITGSVTVLGSVLLYFAVARQFQLMVWVEDAKVYPAPVTRDLSLPLRYGGTDARDVRVATITIANVGSSYIGEQQSLWKLHLSCPEAQSVAVIADPTVIPGSTVWSLLEQTAPNVVSLALGVLEPRSELTLHIMVVNPAKPYIKFKVSTSLVALPEPKVGASLLRQFYERFLPLTGFSSFVVAAVLYFKEVRRLMSAEQQRLWLKIPGSLIWHFLGWVTWSLLLALILSWLAAVVFRAGPIYESMIEWFK